MQKLVGTEMTSFRYRYIWFFAMAGGTYYTIWILMDIKYSGIIFHPVKLDVIPLNNTSPGNRGPNISENEGDANLLSCSTNQIVAQKRVRDVCNTMTQNYKMVRRLLV